MIVAQQGYADRAGCGIYVISAVSNILSTYDEKLSPKDNITKIIGILTCKDIIQEDVIKLNVDRHRIWFSHLIGSQSKLEFKNLTKKQNKSELILVYDTNNNNTNDMSLGQSLCSGMVMKLPDLFLYTLPEERFLTKKIATVPKKSCNPQNVSESIIPHDNQQTKSSSPERRLHQGIYDKFVYLELSTHPSFFLFFHEKLTRTSSTNRRDNEPPTVQTMIMQPNVNHHSVNHFSQNFNRIYEAIKSNSFDDTSHFHLLIYKIQYIQTENQETIARSCLLSSLDSTITNYNPTYTSDNDTTSETPIFDRFNPKFVKKYLLPFIDRLTRLNLFHLEDMKQLDDDLFMFQQLLLKRGIPSDSFFHSSQTYERFFDDGFNDENIDTHSTFTLFNKHVHKLCCIRIATIEGMHRIYTIASYFYGKDFDNKFLENDYINSTKDNCRFSWTCDTPSNQVDSIKVEKELSWLRTFSSSYINNKESYMNTTSIDVLEMMTLPEFCSRKDIFFDRIVKEDKKHSDKRHSFFISTVVPLMNGFINYFIDEAKTNLSNDDSLRLTEPSKKNDIISFSYDLDAKKDPERFWSRLENLRTDNDEGSQYFTKYSMCTLNFAIHNSSTRIKESSLHFIHIFNLKEATRGRVATTYNYIIVCLRSILIAMNIDKFCLSKVEKKIKWTKIIQGIEWKETKESSTKEKIPIHRKRFIDHKFLGKDIFWHTHLY